MCRQYEGISGHDDELPQAPNPDCRNPENCRCYLEFLFDDGTTGDGCFCYENCPDEYFDDDCNCPSGCCCVAADWSRYWSDICDCDGDGVGGDDVINGCFCWEPDDEYIYFDDLCDCPCVYDLWTDTVVCEGYDPEL